MIGIDLKFAIPSLVHQCQASGGYRLLLQEFIENPDITYDLKLDLDTHTYMVDGTIKDCVSDILSIANENSKWFTAESAEKGTWFHNLLNSYDKTRIKGGKITFDKIHEQLRDLAIEVVCEYEIWLASQNKFDPLGKIMIEKSLYSARYNFCGTPDRIIDNGSNKIDCYCLYYTKKGFKLKPYRQGKKDVNDFKILLGANNIKNKWR